MKLSQLIDALPAIQQLSSLRLPIKTSYHVIKFNKAAAKEAESFEETRLLLAKEIGTLSEDGTSYKFEGEASQRWVNEMEELLAAEVELPIGSLKLEAFGDANIDPATLEKLIGVLIEE